MKVFITGGCGFVGANLASEVFRRKEDCVVVDNLSRFGSAENLNWLKSLPCAGRFNFHHLDTRSFSDIDLIIQKEKPDVIFHLAGQVAMTTSIANPRLDFETNVMGTHNLLEAVRKHTPKATVVYSSTNKVYGDLEDYGYEEKLLRYEAKGFPKGFDESVGLNFRSPYGCSKGAADQYMLDYARIFGLNTVVFRHSSIFGGRQFSTFDQGWIGWFVTKALEAKGGGKDCFTISGNGKQVRDVLFASDLIDCYFGAASAIEKVRGQAFNIGGGMENSLSLLELFSFLESKLGVKLNYEKLPWRQSDQKVFVADIGKAKRLFGWVPKVSKETGLEKMIDWVARL
ncbi:GDP-mannose 4,6-dehydratase [Bdellovibrionota bacterium FG-2]